MTGRRDERIAEEVLRCLDGLPAEDQQRVLEFARGLAGRGERPAGSAAEVEIGETRLEDLIGCTGYVGPAKSLEEMEGGVVEGARTLQ